MKRDTNNSNNFVESFLIELKDVKGNKFVVRESISPTGMVELRYVPKEFPSDFTVCFPALTSAQASALANAIIQVTRHLNNE